MRICMQVTFAVAGLAASLLVSPQEASARWRCCRAARGDACYLPPPPCEGLSYPAQPEYVAPPAPAPAPAPAPRTSARVPQQSRIGAYDNYFEPKTITIPSGSTVHWMKLRPASSHGNFG